MLSESLLGVAARVGTKLQGRGETVAVAESSAGGLVSAALLSVPGASAYFRGGAVVYTGDAKRLLAGVTQAEMDMARASTEAHALALARAVRRQLGATWGLGETGATGPTGNRYGDAPGHCCIAIAGDHERQSLATLESGSANRLDNMLRFAEQALLDFDTVLGDRR